MTKLKAEPRLIMNSLIIFFNPKKHLNYFLQLKIVCIAVVCIF
jgi:hypothetical protein